MTEDTLEKTIKLAGVRFRENWKVYDFDASDIDIAVGDQVIVDSEKGPGLASVVRIRRAAVPPSPEPATPPSLEDIPDGVEIDIDSKTPSLPEREGGQREQHATRRVLRKATADDLARDARNRAREDEAFSIAQDLITEREMAMKLIRVEYSFDGSRITFYFFSENRVDFRDLVKDLAFKLKSRIEMRQIGVRDVARLIGGFGPCGRELCCSSFLRNFEPVSIRMAKKQEMVLNPAKISGVCGRLLCCLSYEYEMYEANKKDLADLRQTAIKEKKEEEERKVAEERKEAESRRAEEKKLQQDERRPQEQRRERKKEGGKQEKRKEQGERKGQQERKAGQQPAEQRQRQQPRQEKQQQKQQQKQQKQQQPRPDRQQQRPEQQAAVEPPSAAAPEIPVPQPEGAEKAGRKKRRRFWRKKKKGQGGDAQAPTGPQGGGGPQGS